MSIAAYIRVSTDGGRQKTDSQRMEIEHYLARHQFVNVRWFEDRASGKNLQRPGFHALQEAIHRGEIETVICSKIDRLARNLKEGFLLISDWSQRGIRLVAVTQAIDLSGSIIGQMVAGVLFAFAEIELQHSKERQAAGIALAKERGIYKGRKPGTRKASRERARALRAGGFKIQEIADALNISRSTVINYLNAEEESA